MEMVDDESQRQRAARFVANGMLAAGVHFAVLSACIELDLVHSAGLANMLAAIAGTIASFIGSRHFVFRAAHRPVLGQAVRFMTLYALIALLHGASLWLWADVLGLDYRIGFLIAVALQVILSYLGNQRLVFR